MERKHSLSSSSSPPGKKYDVFLSFRGEDTRYNFTGHLSHSLRKIGLFNIFMDDCALGQGKDIDLELMKAIEDSQYAVVVLSKNYATSSWCLKELAQIVKCMGEPESGRIRTIFYHVDPFHVRNVKSSEVKKQKESSFWKALEEHAKNPSHCKDLESWRDALFKIANQSGHHVKADMDETSFIENFVADISRELGASIRTTDGLFGMTSRLLALDSYVLEYSAANNVCFIGIHGMGGIGKSTLAGAYYMKMSHKFEGSSFLGNVRFFCDKVVNGLVDLQKQLLKDILGEDLAVGHEINGKALIKNRLHAKKVLIILDDVNKPEQLDALADSHTWFCPGSVIIVTTRDKTFKRIEPPEEFKKLSTEVVEYAAKLPLALTVLGSLLAERRKVYGKMYCDSCGFHSNLGISNLIDKSLLSIKQYGQIWMHDLLQEMGKGIVRKNSGNELQRQSRIWNEVDLNQILEKKEGTNEVEAIVTDVHEVCRFEALSSVKKLRLLWINAEGLLLEQKSERMNMEEFGYDGPYDLDELYDCDGPELSNNLQYLEWSGFPYNKLPSSFQPRNLVQMKLRRANIKQLWNNCIEPLHKLKVIDLSFSSHFSKFEDFSVFPNLESLILVGCERLSEIHPSIKYLKKLIVLDMQLCRSLEKLPEDLNGLTSLQTLELFYCFMLRKLPDNLEQLKSLRNLNIRASGIRHLPSSIFLMENLESLSCDNEKMIESAIRRNIISYHTIDKFFFPGSFRTSLTSLDLTDCNLSGPEAFPEYFGKLVSLRALDLSKNPFSVLPPGINGLSRLSSLTLEHCENLRCLEPELLPSSLEEDSERRYQDFRFVVPHSDDELPSWFINQSLAASINIKLDPNWCSSSELIGFAVVFCFRANSSPKDNFSCYIRVRGGERDQIWVLEVTKRKMSDHLYILYSPCKYSSESTEQLEPPSCDAIEFSFSGPDDDEDCSCGPCGVRWVYEEDIEDLKEITSIYNNDQSPDKKDAQSSHSQSISHLSKLRHMSPIGSLWTGLKGTLDLVDNLELVEMHRYPDEDPPNPGSNPSMVGNTHFGVFRDYSGITTKFLDK
ncbi:hypothetical protein FNV43_RR09566 [Rhamnella rubrinervis]|uniref:ADP-ribosyl cyclase/cyclic ADP-ribose hydrolase n=1 Tax=Rhamnella rubrinervis TaxID=2594499 RepID=A0A8K0MJX3_9ROSA|nr:hypothetical protein FNV43_RR09566 [Rhamnella rubrinervis]